MLRVYKPATPSLYPDFMSTKLSTTANNWIRYSEFWKDHALYNFGVSGQAIRLGEIIPLKYPPPDRNALFVNSEGHPVANHFVYKRETPATRAENEQYAMLSSEEKTLFLIDSPLTDPGQSKFDRDTSISSTYINTRIADDNAQHALLAMSISDASLAALRLHDKYAEYTHTNAPWNRSILYYHMLADIHQFGDASTKYHRTSALVLGKHDPATQSFDEWTNWLNEQFAQFQVDFESTDQKGYFHCGEFKSFLFLQGTDRAMFRTVYDEQLRTTPTGRFPDPDALIKLFQNYHRSHTMSMSDPTSTQGGNSFSAATKSNLITPAATKSNSHASTPASQVGKRGKAYPNPCPHCLKVLKAKNYGHDPDGCSNNPNHAPPAKANNAKAQPPVTTITQPAETTRLDQLEQSMERLIGFLAQTEPSAALLATSTTTHVPPETPSARIDRIETLVTSFIYNMMSKEGEEA